MRTYDCTVIYGWMEGDLKVWDETVIQVTDDLFYIDERDEVSGNLIKSQALYLFNVTIGQDMRGYSFAFVDSIEDADEWEDPDIDEDPDHHAIPEDAQLGHEPSEFHLFGPEDTRDHGDE